MKKYYFLIIVALILGLVLTGCSLLSNISQVPATEQSGITYLTKSFSNLVGMWHFDEGVGTTAIDSSGNGNNGDLINGTNWTTSGKFGNALNFDGINDYVRIANDPSLNITQGTWEAWIKFDAKPSDVGHPMNPLAKANQYWIHGSLGDQDSGTTDAIVVKIRIGGTRYCAKTDSNFITASEWYHVAGTYDGGTLKLYVNGILEDSNTAPNGNINIGTPIMAVGTWSTLIDYFQGTIDEVRIYDYALSPSTIADHAAGIYGFSGLLAPYAPPVEKAFKAGRTIPLKWQYTGPAGNVVNSASVEPIVRYVYINGENGTGILDEEDNAPGASGLQYDAFTMTWQFNWQTKDWKTGTYEIWITNRQTDQVNGPFLIELR